MKSGLDIEQDVFDVVSASLKSIIKGKTYRDGMRPVDAQTEDCVVAFLTGVDGQRQSGIVNVNIYVPNISVKGYSKKVKNIGRLNALAHDVRDAFTKAETPEYELTTDSTPRTYEVSDIEQYFINFRISYKRISVND
jgi:hypothetical protein